jgi:hypothetical protein
MEERSAMYTNCVPDRSKRARVRARARFSYRLSECLAIFVLAGITDVYRLIS